MGHNVGAKAESAVEKSKKVKPSERTPEQILADIRRNLSSGLAVTPQDQRWLLVEYDKNTGALLGACDVAAVLGDKIADLKALISQLRAEGARQDAVIAELQAKLEEFRAVYEQENRRTTLQVDTLAPVPEILVEQVINDPTLAGSAE